MGKRFERSDESKQESINIFKTLDSYYLIKNKEISLLDFLSVFNDDNFCLDFLFAFQYKDELCPKCYVSINDNYIRVKSFNKNGDQRKSYGCVKCSHQIFPTAKTAMEKTNLPISRWFYLMYNTCISKKNTSALQMEKNVDTCYKTSHRVMKLIRYALHQPKYDNKMKGVVEIDEAFIGKGNLWSRWGNGFSTRKQPILGFFERDTKLVRVFLVNDRKIKTLDEIILQNVEVDSTIYTDDWSGYNNLDTYYEHDTVCHSRHEYARGDVHTQSIENFWGILKSTIRGAHRKVHFNYVQHYVDEIVWKYNNKHLTSMQRFDDLLNRIVNTNISKLNTVNAHYK